MKFYRNVTLLMLLLILVFWVGGKVFDLNTDFYVGFFVAYYIIYLNAYVAVKRWVPAVTRWELEAARFEIQAIESTNPSNTPIYDQMKGKP